MVIDQLDSGSVQGGSTWRTSQALQHQVTPTTTLGHGNLIFGFVVKGRGISRALDLKRLVARWIALNCLVSALYTERWGFVIGMIGSDVVRLS